MILFYIIKSYFILFNKKLFYFIKNDFISYNKKLNFIDYVLTDI